MLGDELAVFVVVEAGDAVAVGGADEVAVRVVAVNGFLVVYEQIKNALNQGRLSIHILLVTG